MILSGFHERPAANFTGEAYSSPLIWYLNEALNRDSRFEIEYLNKLAVLSLTWNLDYRNQTLYC